MSNVIYPDFGHTPQDLPCVLAAVTIPHVDDEVAVVRLEVQIGDRSWVSHALYPVDE